MNRILPLTACFAMAAAACSTPGPDGEGGDPSVTDPTATGGDLPLGDVEGDTKADGQWGAALTCKDIPVYPALVNPTITISLNGLTLHLVDPTTGYDKVFPIGPGQIETDASKPGYLESHSWLPLKSNPTGNFALHPATNTACKTWWTDPDTGAKSPVFAGLPFMSWYGDYAIHGPIDNYTAANGGTLRRGFVSHGCIRMEAADVLEVYSRIKSVQTVPVHVQREPERDSDGNRVDIPQPWVGAECNADSDCAAIPNGYCHANKYSERGFCTTACTTSCADRPNYPTTFCVADPDNAGKGMCVDKTMSTNYNCRPYEDMQPVTLSRNTQPSVKAQVCVPGSPGWVGDKCLVNSDCKNGTTCAGASGGTPGQCTESCSGSCPDQPGFPTTFCASEPSLGGNVCMRQCNPNSNLAECPADSQCVQRNRAGRSGSAYICEPL
jgi:hypothetical protein